MKQPQSKIECIGELLAEKFEPKREIMGKWLTEGSLTLLYAPRGIGKTFLSLELGHAIATGRKFLKWQPQNPMPVILFDGEMGRQSLADRLWSIDKAADISIIGSAMRIGSFEHFDHEMPNLASLDGQEIYTKEIGAIPVVIIDNLLTCSGPSDARDDDIKQWMRIQKWALRMRSQRKAVIIIHHAGKSGQQIGTSFRENVMDTIVALKKVNSDSDVDGFQIEMHFEKTRHFYGQDAEPLFVKYNASGSWNWSPLRDWQISEVARLSDAGYDNTTISERLGVSHGYVAQLLRGKAW